MKLDLTKKEVKLLEGLLISSKKELNQSKNEIRKVNPFGSKKILKKKLQVLGTLDQRIQSINHILQLIEIRNANERGTKYARNKNKSRVPIKRRYKKIRRIHKQRLSNHRF